GRARRATRRPGGCRRECRAPAARGALQNQAGRTLKQEWAARATAPRLRGSSASRYALMSRFRSALSSALPAPAGLAPTSGRRKADAGCHASANRRSSVVLFSRRRDRPSSMRPNWFFAFPLDGAFVLDLPKVPRGFRRYHPADVHLTLAF